MALITIALLGRPRRSRDGVGHPKCSPTSAPGRGPLPSGPVLVRRAGDARRSPLPSSGRDLASRAGATPAGPLLDRRVLAPSPSDATRRPMGWRHPFVLVRICTGTPHPSTRSATWSRTSVATATTTPASRSSSCWAGPAPPTPPTRATCSLRSSRRGRLVGRASAHGGRDQPARAGAPSHRGWSTGLLGTSASGVARQRGVVHHYATIVVDGISREVLVHKLDGSDRERNYRRREEIYPGFTHYRRWAASRQIPVLRLKPLSRRAAPPALRGSTRAF